MTLLRLIPAAICAVAFAWASPAGAQCFGQLAAGQICGNSSASQALPVPNTVGPFIDRSISSTRGSILERGAGGWSAITPGTAGGPFISNGAGADPSYGTRSGNTTTFATTSGTLTSGHTAALDASGNIVDGGALASGATGGRVTLISGTCVARTDQVAMTVVYYAPCNGSSAVPIYDGTLMAGRTFTSSTTDQVGLTLTLGSNWAASTIYDLFVTLQAGVPTLCTVAWSSSGAGTSTRATAIAFYQGVPVNNAVATCRTTNSATISCAQYQCTLVGGFLTNGSTGQVDLKFGTNATGGGTACICIWSFYNQVQADVSVGDTTTTWNYTTAAFRAANGNTNNSINVLQGLAGPPVDARVRAFAQNTNVNVAMTPGIGINICTADSSSVRIPAFTNVVNSATIATAELNGVGAYLSAGLNNICREEYSLAIGTSTWIGQVVANQIQTGIVGIIWY